LAERLAETKRVVTVGEFSNGPTGRIIRDSQAQAHTRFIKLHDHDRYADLTYLVLIADVVAKASTAIHDNADIAVIDRFSDSWFCYTLASTNRVIVDDDVIQRMHERSRELFAPIDVQTVYLRIDAEEAARRLALRDGRSDRKEETEKLVRIHASFERLYERMLVHCVDATRPRSAVTEDILRGLAL